MLPSAELQTPVPANDGTWPDTDAYERDAAGQIWLLAPYRAIHGCLDAIEARYPDQVTAGVREPNLGLGLRVRLPTELGRGYWDLIRASEEIVVLNADAQYSHDQRIEVQGDRLFKIRVMLSGRLWHLGSGIRLEGTGAYLDADPGLGASDYMVGGGTRLRMVVLNCRPRLLVERFGLRLGDVPEPMRALFDLPSAAPHRTIAAIGPDVLRAANHILNAPAHFPASLVRPYIAAKAEEILCAVVRQLSREAVPAGPPLSVRDVGRTYEARDILLEHYARPPSIIQLARQVGVNQTKLKSSFKAVFDITIYDFILQRRMERGFELLTDGHLTIAEIAYAVGYEYPANFTHAFKRQFGYLPRDLRRSARSPTSTVTGVNAIGRDTH